MAEPRTTAEALRRYQEEKDVAAKAMAEQEEQRRLQNMTPDQRNAEKYRKAMEDYRKAQSEQNKGFFERLLSR